MGDLKYVDDFEFPSDRGFTGSAGVQHVKGYARGGKVKSTNEPANARRAKAKPMTPAARGGHMKHGKHVGGPKPEKEYPASQAHQTMPKNVKARGGKAKSLHDKMYDEGAKMGYAQGGQVKDTSGEFVEKRGAQDTMDKGIKPAQRGKNAASENDKQNGPGRTRQKFARGGVHQVRDVRGRGRAGGAKTEGERAREMKGPNPDHTKGKGRTKKGMPKAVKRMGGLAQANMGMGGAARYAEGGPAGDFGGGMKKGGKAKKKATIKDVPGTGQLKRVAKKALSRAERMEQMRKMATKAHGAKKTKKAMGGAVKGTRTAADKPFKNYDQREGASGNEDDRYMQTKKRAAAR